MGLMVTLIWVPAHHRVKGNDGRQNSKGSYKETIMDMEISVSRTAIKSRIWHKIKERWQRQWEEER